MEEELLEMGRGMRVADAMRGSRLRMLLVVWPVSSMPHPISNNSSSITQ
jgi:hypothetical protein